MMNVNFIVPVKERIGNLLPRTNFLMLGLFSLLTLPWCLNAQTVAVQERQSSSGNIALMLDAIEHGNLEVVELLLEQGVAVESTLYQGRTLLILACHHQGLEIAQLLIDRGADVNRISRDDYTPLIEAAEHGPLAMVELLVNSGGEVNQSAYNEHTALMLAAENGHQDIVEFLLENGADRAAIAHDDWTAYDHAMLGDNNSIARLIGAEHAGVYDENGNHRHTDRTTRNGRRVSRTTTTITRSSSGGGETVNIYGDADSNWNTDNSNIERTEIIGDGWPEGLSNVEIKHPIRSHLEVSMDVANAVRRGKVLVLDMDGEVVRVIHNGRLGSGGHTFSHSVDDLPKDTYWLFIEINGEAYQEQIGRNTPYRWRNR